MELKKWKTLKYLCYSKEVEEFKVNVIKKYALKCIILYGSLAKGDYNERSDIDLTIISDNYFRISQCIKFLSIIICIY